MESIGLVVVARGWNYNTTRESAQCRNEIVTAICIFQASEQT